MKVTAQKFHKLGFLAALGGFAITAAICKAASSTQDTSQPIWPTDSQFKPGNPTLELERSVGHNPVTEITDSRYASLRSDWSSKALIGWNYQRKASCHRYSTPVSGPINSER
jgi:hypothetical protein